VTENRVVPFGRGTGKGGNGEPTGTGTGPGSDEEKVPIEITEDSLAQVFVDENLDRIRYDHDAGAWYLWDGVRWARDDTGTAAERCRHINRRFGHLDSKLAKALGSARAVKGVEWLARTDQRVAVLASAWDSDPWLLGTPGGTVDLRTGELRKPDPADMMTKLTGVAPAPEGTEPKRFLGFLDQAMQGDRQLIDMLQRDAGYALTGLTSEQKLWFHHGAGGNGKGTYFTAIRKAMGDYAVEAAEDVFASAGAGKHTTDLAMLKGARLVTAAETEEGKPWNEARIKRVTGGDPITARLVHENNFTFRPEFKLWAMGNHKPVIRQVDEAIRRRVLLVPWLFTPEFPDPELEETLTEELPMILRWQIEGCILWQAEGRIAPEIVQRSTAKYLEDQDVLFAWMGEKCDVEPESTQPELQTRTLATRLFGSWKAWSTANGENSGSMRSFYDALEKRGFERKRSMHGWEFFRLKLRSEQDHLTGAWGRPGGM
jgi:putative DNA primase/helicase